MAVDVSSQLDTHVKLSAVAFIDAAHGTNIGSGTLVKLGPVLGVVTCGHNVHAFNQLEIQRGRLKLGFLAYPVRSQRQQLTVDYSLVSRVHTYNPNPVRKDDWRGPDIAFLRLPAPTASSLMSIASFVDLGAQLLNWQQPLRGSAIEVVAGAIAISSSPAILTPPTAAVTQNIDGLMNVGKADRRSPVRGSDRLYFRPTPEPGFSLPSTFQGTSGGGFWRLGFTVDATGKAVLVDRRLAGVAYFETKRSAIICHGPSGIYVDLLQMMRTQWPDCP